MRKMTWWATGVAVCGACAVFFIARYAAENPDSFVGRCARAAYYVGARANPLVYLSQPAANEPGFAGRPVAGARFPIPAPEMPAEENQEQPAVERSEPLESIVVEDGDETAQAVTPTEETEKTPPSADEKEIDQVPATMPYADDDDAEVQEFGNEACLTEFFRWLVESPGCCAKSCPSCGQGLIDSVVDCIKDLSGQETNSTQPEVPADPAPAGSGEEAQETRTPTPDATFREDPHYHQYPGCPYTGPCPYPHYYNLPPVMGPANKKTDKPAPQSHLILDEERIMQWTQAATTDAGLKAVFANLESVAHPEIDTMECRPTDVPDLYYTDETF